MDCFDPDWVWQELQLATEAMQQLEAKLAILFLLFECDG